MSAMFFLGMLLGLARMSVRRVIIDLRRRVVARQCQLTREAEQGEEEDAAASTSTA